MNKVRVLLAEDHTIVRQGLESLLRSEPDIEVVGEAINGQEALQKVEQLYPDVVLMDISMPLLNGLEATRRIQQQFPKVKVLILSVHANEEHVLQALQAGASGYLLKDTAVSDLVSAIRAVHHGDFFLSPAISRTVIEAYLRGATTATETNSYSKLTDREREVLQLIAEGYSTREIAQLLHISEKTVRAHRTNLMSKLDVHNTAELVRYAIRKGVIRSDA